MDDIYNRFCTRFGKERVKEREPLSKHTYFKIGGPADIYVQAFTQDDLEKAVVTCREIKIPFIILGSGSNILVGDGGFRGVVIQNKASDIHLVGLKGRHNSDEEKKEVFVEAESGTLFNHLIRYTVSEGLQGLEGFLGTPGTIGGALYNNAHFKDKLVGDYVSSAVILTKEGRKDVDRSYFQFAYDYSILHKTHDILLSAIFRLLPGNKAELWKEATESVTRRRDTQPLDLPSSGCAWKNVESGKLSTGYLIDECGLKEQSVGGAKISGKHANFIVNEGKASAQDVIDLMKLSQKAVKEKFGYTLEPEIFFIGEFQDNPFRKE